MYLVFALIFLLILGMDLFRHVQSRKRKMEQNTQEAISQKEEAVSGTVYPHSSSVSFEPSLEKEPSVEHGFFVAVYQNRMIVYLDDKETVYEYTNIDTRELPLELRSKLSDGFYIKTEEELYHFLESYSS